MVIRDFAASQVNRTGFMIGGVKKQCTLQEIFVAGAQRHFSGPGVAVSIRVSLWCNHLHDARENPIFPVLHRARCCVLVEEFLQPEETEYSR